MSAAPGELAPAIPLPAGGRRDALCLAALFAVWAGFAAWCCAGFPPCVDLPAHGAQLETLANLVRGDAAVGATYAVKFPQGYGLILWLLLPLALATNGAFAVRFGLWVALLLFPVSEYALVRSFRRSPWIVVLGLPLAFNLSYWYGLLPGLFAQPMAMFALAAFVRALEPGAPRRWIAWVNLLAAATFLSHLVAFAALAVCIAAAALVPRPSRASVARAAAGLAVPVLLSVPKVWSMATRAVTPGPWPATQYAAISHLNWFFRNYRPEGALAAALPLAITALLLALWIARRRQEPKVPFALFAALGLLYLATPKTLSGIFLVSVRLPVLAGMASLALVDWRSVPAAARAAAAVLVLASLAETARFHGRFGREVAGLSEVMEGGPPGRHAYLPLEGNTVLGSKQIYLEHLGQWLTASRGGVGHNFFADAEHHPVRFAGAEVPADLRLFSAAQLAALDTVLLYGDGPAPPFLSSMAEVKRAGKWRRLERTHPGRAGEVTGRDPALAAE